MAFDGLVPSTPALIGGVLLDALIGDPQYALHPIRVMGGSLTAFERLLRKLRCNGYIGGCLLFLLLGVVWVIVPSVVVYRLTVWNPTAGFIVQVFLVYSLLALRDLFNHVWAVQQAARADDLTRAREAIARLVGRDTDKMNFDACRRAAIESLSENFVDGFLSALFWYTVLGLPGLLLFKVVSTMDSMVGYKTPLYLRFGWCGARLDDVMNYVPARIAWLLLGFAAIVVPSTSALKGWRIGLLQHAILPGPNPGWSEATMAGILQRRLIGPIWKAGHVVTTLWIGDSADPEGGKEIDVTRAMWIVAIASIIAVAAACVAATTATQILAGASAAPVLLLIH